MSTLSNFTIPKTQTAAVVKATGAELAIDKEHPVRQASELKPGECLVKISYTGVCHTDLHAKSGDWPVPPSHPLIGGHEGESDEFGRAVFFRPPVIRSKRATAGLPLT